MKQMEVSNKTMKQRIAGCVYHTMRWAKEKQMELTALALASGVCITPTYASSDPKQVVITLLDKIIEIFPAIGIIIALVGAFKLFMAFRSDQPEGYSSAGKEIAIGVVLIIFKAFIWDTIKGVG